MQQTDWGSRSTSQRLQETLARAMPMIPGHSRGELEKFITPEALEVMAAVVGAWVAAHFVGVGEAVDMVLAVVGFLAIGMAVFDGIGHLWEFAKSCSEARTDADLNVAAKHFAEAVAILGIQAGLAILFRNRPRSYKGGRMDVRTSPPQTTGAGIAQPGLRATRSLGAGGGTTDIWGEIVISRLGTSTDRRLAALHESVHRFLTPRLHVLRRFRVRNRTQSYSRSMLSKYLEEAVAETYAQVGVNGFRAVFRGISFPVKERYVTLLRTDGELLPFLPEAGGLTAGGFSIGGMVFQIWETPRLPRPNPAVR